MVSEALKAQMRETVARYPQARSAMLPCLHLAQDELGYITEEAIVAVAEAIGVKSDEVESVVTFYSMFHQKPKGSHVIKVCTSVSCYLRGCDAVVEGLERTLGVRRGGTTPDGRFTLEAVECLAACGMAPALQVNGEFAEQVTPENAERLVEFLASGGEMAQVSNRWRLISDGLGMATETEIGASQPSDNGVSSTKKVR
ncbi:MAG TPA: NADH-quinone oxidoreductase subunit NuoE [Ktedonobacterales bacterium]|jgi:NADH-quinone oxidoreductase E subunit|nr:NADH-quinone oxidoreductase subunit NuoE [Ktedonobacterales bacterium]